MGRLHLGLLAVLVAAVVGHAAVLVNGAGATFPYPIYSKWFDEFHKRRPDVQINYQSIGSGGGIRQVTEGTVDFGATDGPMTDEQLAQTKVPILHFPTVLGAVVPTFNLPGAPRLRFTPEALAGIFLGTITRWDDPVLAKENPGVALPGQPIVPVHRSDGSGTTYVFVDYLSKVSPTWAKQVGRGTAVNWPVGLGGKGNEGVAGLVKQTPDSLGYVELIYALQNNLPYGDVRNRSGKFVQASLESVTAAAATTGGDMPADFRVSITDPSAPTATPSPPSPGSWCRPVSRTLPRAGSSRTSSDGCWATDNRSPKVSATRRCRRRSWRWSGRRSPRCTSVRSRGMEPIPELGPSATISRSASRRWCSSGRGSRPASLRR